MSFIEPSLWFLLGTSTAPGLDPLSTQSSWEPSKWGTERTGWFDMDRWFRCLVPVLFGSMYYNFIQFMYVFIVDVYLNTCMYGLCKCKSLVRSVCTWPPKSHVWNTISFVHFNYFQGNLMWIGLNSDVSNSGRCDFDRNPTLLLGTLNLPKAPAAGA